MSTFRESTENGTVCAIDGGGDLGTSFAVFACFTVRSIGKMGPEQGVQASEAGERSVHMRRIPLVSLGKAQGDSVVR